MSENLEPNEEGTVCSVCRKAIVPYVDAVHGAYWGVEARHYECTATGRASRSGKTMTQEFDELRAKVDESVQRLKRAIRESDR